MNLLFSFTDKWLSLPIWAWIVIAAVVLILIIVIAVVAAKAARAKKQSAASEELPETAAPAEEGESSLDEEYVPEDKAAPVAQSSAEPVPAEPAKAAPASAESSSAPAEEEKPVAKVRTEFVRKTPVQPKPVQQAQPAQAKPAPQAEPAPAQPVQSQQTDAAKLGGIKVYHITKRKLDGKWQIKFNNGKKAIKLFDTQLQAIEYAKALAINQEASIMIHKEDGTFRKLRYDKPNK